MAFKTGRHFLQIPGPTTIPDRVLRAMEDSGRARRGYVVEGLGAAQFAVPGAVDRLRAFAELPSSVTGQASPRSKHDDSSGPTAIVLAATDPANPFGAALTWPLSAGAEGGRGHRPGRKAGALVVLVDGELILYVERGGRTLLTFSDTDALLLAAARALAAAVHDGWLGRLAVERTDGEHALASPAAAVLEQAGFVATPGGLRLRR